MAKIIRSPELRYTQENQTPIAQMLVEFAGPRSEDPPATLRVVGWGNLASEIQENYREGEHVILVGRLSMNTVDRQEGFKEKRAEMTVSQIFPGPSAVAALSSSSTPAQSAPSDSFDSGADFTQEATVATAAQSEENLDDIPF